METKEAYEVTAGPQNGATAPSDAPGPLEPIEWCELAQVSVTLVYARRRANEHGSLLLKNHAFNPVPVFADTEAGDLPYGRALEKLIVAGLKQAEEMG